MKRPGLLGLASAMLGLAGLGACPPIERPITGRLGRAKFALENVSTSQLPCLALGSHATLRVFFDGEYTVSSALPQALMATRVDDGALLTAFTAGAVDLNLLDPQGRMIDVIEVCTEAAQTIEVADVKSLAGGPRVIEGDTVSVAVERRGLSGKLAGRGGYTVAATGEIAGEMIESERADVLTFIAHSDGKLTLSSGDASMALPVTKVSADAVDQAKLSTITCVNDDSRGSTLCGLSLQASAAGQPIYRPTCSFTVTPAEGLHISDNGAFNVEGDPERAWEVFSTPGSYEVRCRVGKLERSVTIEIQR
jgi:hypothetical protein